MPVNFQQLEKDYDALRIEHSQLIAKTQWQPIASAPKDGTWVILSDGKTVAPAYWDSTYFGSDPMWIEYSHRADYQKAEVENPTHWQPLPDPPQEPSHD